MTGVQRLGLIGAGGMATTVLRALSEHLPAPLDHLAWLLRPGRTADAELAGRLARTVALHTDLAAFLADRPNLVVECAGHEAVRRHGVAVLASGADLVVASSGALTDDALRAALEDAARRGGASLVVPAGAVGGLDVLAAARLSGLHDVTYAGRKPPLAWRGTPAEDLVDLSSLREAATFFAGSAREAASRFPQNANVAATVALAGLGMDRTRVHLIADPAITRNVHEITVRSAAVDATMVIEGRPSPANAKTSLTAGFSVAAEVLARAARPL